MHNYEIEIKSLLGSKDKADDLVNRMKEKDPNLKILGSHKQLNHYFAGGNLKSLYDKVQNLLDDASRSKLKDLAKKAKAESRTGAQATGTGNFSVRTRDADGKVILVVKATVDDTTSSNGTARLEWETTPHFPSPLRGEGGGEGEHLKINVAVDKNAGYGYLAEFEMVVDDKDKADDAKNLIRTVMGALEIDELPQDRLERMFDFYNKNWQDYYGTEKTFTIE